MSLTTYCTRMYAFSSCLRFRDNARRSVTLPILPVTFLSNSPALTGLLVGKQGISSPVALLATCCGSKSLKVILIDSDFRAYTAKMGDGGVFHTPCAYFCRPVEELEYTRLLKNTFTEASHVRGFKT